MSKLFDTTPLHTSIPKNKNKDNYPMSKRFDTTPLHTCPFQKRPQVKENFI